MCILGSWTRHSRTCGVTSELTLRTRRSRTHRLHVETLALAVDEFDELFEARVGLVAARDVDVLAVVGHLDDWHVRPLEATAGEFPTAAVSRRATTLTKADAAAHSRMFPGDEMPSASYSLICCFQSR